MFFRCDELKGLVIPEHSENGVTDFVHDSPCGNNLFPAGTFADVIIVNDRVHWRFCCFVHFQVVDDGHMQDAPGKAGAPLGHVDSVSMELAGICCPDAPGIPGRVLYTAGSGGHCYGGHARKQRHSLPRRTGHHILPGHTFPKSVPWNGSFPPSSPLVR